MIPNKEEEALLRLLAKWAEHDPRSSHFYHEVMHALGITDVSKVDNLMSRLAAYRYVKVTRLYLESEMPNTPFVPSAGTVDVVRKLDANRAQQIAEGKRRAAEAKKPPDFATRTKERLRRNRWVGPFIGLSEAIGPVGGLILAIVGVASLALSLYFRNSPAPEKPPQQDPVAETRPAKPQE